MTVLLLTTGVLTAFGSIVALQAYVSLQIAERYRMSADVGVEPVVPGAD